MNELIPRERAFDLFQRSTATTLRLLDTMPVPADTPIPHMDWTVGELAAHLVQGAEIAGQLVDGTPSPYLSFDKIADMNEELLAQKPERDLAILAQQYRHAIADLERKFRELPDDARVPFHQGWQLTPAQAMTMTACEHLLHAWDLSTLTEHQLKIESDDARLILYVLAYVMPNVVDRERARGFTATCELRVRGGACFRLHFEDGDLTVSSVQPGGPADCRLLVDPVAFLLSGYGRGSQLLPALTGKVVVWGRKPWLAAKMMSMVKTP